MRLRKLLWTTRNSLQLLQRLLALILLAAASAPAQTPKTAILPTQMPGQDAILVGTDWYPEQWPESQWEHDLRLMEAGHIKVVRIAEFACSRMEPSEGHYDFEWLVARLLHRCQEGS